MDSFDTRESRAEALLGTAALTSLEILREEGIEPAQARRPWRARVELSSLAPGDVLQQAQCPTGGR